MPCPSQNRKWETGIPVQCITACSQSTRRGMNLFQAASSLCFKVRVKAEDLIWKWCFILMQIKLIQEIFERKVLASFWKLGSLKLGNGLFKTIGHRGQNILISVFHNITCILLVHKQLIFTSFFKLSYKNQLKSRLLRKNISRNFNFSNASLEEKHQKPILFQSHSLNLFRKCC